MSISVTSRPFSAARNPPCASAGCHAACICAYSGSAGDPSGKNRRKSLRNAMRCGFDSSSSAVRFPVRVFPVSECRAGQDRQDRSGRKVCGQGRDRGDSAVPMGDRDPAAAEFRSVKSGSSAWIPGQRRQCRSSLHAIPVPIRMDIDLAVVLQAPKPRRFTHRCDRSSLLADNAGVICGSCRADRGYRFQAPCPADSCEYHRWCNAHGWHGKSRQPYRGAGASPKALDDRVTRPGNTWKPASRPFCRRIGP